MNYQIERSRWLRGKVSPLVDERGNGCALGLTTFLSEKPLAYLNFTPFTSHIGQLSAHKIMLVNDCASASLETLAEILGYTLARAGTPDEIEALRERMLADLFAKAGHTLEFVP